MKKYKHNQTGNIATSIGYTNYYMMTPLNETVHKSLIENSNDWELIKPTIEVGKVYKTDNDMYKSMYLILNKLVDNTFEIIGFDIYGNWMERCNFDLYKSTEATKEEWLERLKIEAKKRGLVKGVKFKSAISDSTFMLNDFHLDEGMGLFDKKFGCLMDFETGKWAIPIEEKKTIITTHDGVELFDGDLKVHYIDRCSFAYYTTKLKYYKEHYANCEVFSTRQKAQEYIDNNQKRYSLNDIINANKNTYNLPIGMLIFELKKINK